MFVGPSWSTLLEFRAQGLGHKALASVTLQEKTIFESKLTSNFLDIT